MGGTRGGQANEAGSVHRTAVAAYLAAQGLAGRAACGGTHPVAATVTSVAFETSDAVDDIQCGLSDGSVLLLQAKRACGAGAPLRATVAQWVAQWRASSTADEGPPMLVGLAVAEAKGFVRILPRALDRRRLPDPGVESAAERAAIAAVRAAFPDDVTPVECDRILDVAHVLVIDAAEAPAPQFETAAAWLQAAGVPAGRADAAVRALQALFHTRAGSAKGTTVDEWLDALAGAGVPVTADNRGAPGQRRQAERNAVGGHRARLAAELGWLSFTPLAANLPRMRVDDLPESFRVTLPAAPGETRTREDGLVEFARRWGRLVLTGLPGAGKSTAIAQLAAVWGTDPDAPIPLLVPLSRLAHSVSTAADVTVETLVDVAARGAPRHESEPLRHALAAAVRNGDAALLLDGLDECGNKAGVVADGLASVIERIHADTDVIVTTRVNAAAAAAKMRLPEVALGEPRWLARTLEQLVAHAAETRAPAGEHDEWIARLQAWLHDAAARDPGLWRVPLLATVMTLLATTRPLEVMPRERARLLASAVEQSVTNWENARTTDNGGWRLGLRSEMLIDGFAISAHQVAAAACGAAHEQAVHAALATHLKNQWGQAPRFADAIARDIMRFWDGTAGAFLLTGDGDVEPRSRHLVEVGDAMWAAAQDQAGQRQWVRAAVCDDDRREAVVLAAGLAPAILLELVVAVNQAADAKTRARALLWATDAAVEAADTARSSDVQVTGALVDALAAAGRDRLNPSRAVRADPVGRISAGAEDRQLKRDGPGWQFVWRLAALPLPPELRHRREQHLVALPLTDEQRVVADALRLLTDARSDGIVRLDGTARCAVAALLALPVPNDQVEARHVSRRYFVFDGETRVLLSGHAHAAALAADHVDEFCADAPAVLYRIAHTASHHVYTDIATRLVKHGHPDPEPLMLKAMRLFGHFPDRWTSWNWFFSAAAAVNAPADLTPRARWRLPDLARLADIVGLAQASIRDLDTARRADVGLLTRLFAATAAAYGLDTAQIAAQAAVVVHAGDVNQFTPLDVVLAPAPPIRAVAQDRPQPPPLTDVDMLITALGSPADLVANAAFDLLIAVTNDDTSCRIRAASPALSARRRRPAAILVVVHADDPVGIAESLLRSPDPPTRVGATRALKCLLPTAGDAQRARRVLAACRDDRDLTVRRAGGASDIDALAADYWSCPDCAEIHPVATLDCANCPTGTRPGPHP